MKTIKVRHALLIVCLWEIALTTFFVFFSEGIGALRTYGGYLNYPIGLIVWGIVLAVFGGILPFCFADWKR